MSNNSPAGVVEYTKELEKMREIKILENEANGLFHEITELLDFNRRINYSDFIEHVQHINEFGEHPSSQIARDKYKGLITPEISQVVQKYTNKKRTLHTLKGSTRCDAFTEAENPP